MGLEVQRSALSGPSVTEAASVEPEGGKGARAAAEWRETKRISLCPFDAVMTDDGRGWWR